MTAKNKPYHHGDLRNALIKGALVLIRAKGPNAISLREVAKKAGVSHAAPYRHFPDKNALLCSIAEQGYEALGQRLIDTEKAHTDPREQVRQVAVGYAELALESPEVTQLMFGGYIEYEKRTEGLIGKVDVARDAMLRIFKNGIAAGLYESNDSELLMTAFWSLIHGLSLLIIGRQLPPDLTDTPDKLSTLCLQFADWMLDGLTAQ